jgi:transcription elongation factor GreA
MRPKFKLKKFLFTKARLEELEKEKQQLVIDREKTVLELSDARAMGDLSENGYYKAARQKLSSTDRRIRQVEIFLLNAQIISGSRNDIVSLGSKVRVDISGKEREFMIVGEEEANPSAGKISNRSPIGRALLGKKKGDSIEIEAPGGRTWYEIKAIHKGE